MDYKKKIRDSSLGFTMKITARNVFTEWLKSAKIAYDLSPEFIESIEYNNIESIFIEHLEKAINALIENKSDNKRKVSGWSYGYLCGHLQGSIDTAWTHKYIIEPSKEYEDMLKLKSIIEYINMDEYPITPIYSIYNYLIAKRIQPIEFKDDVPDNVVSIHSQKRSDISKEKEFKKSIIDLLSNELKTRIIKSLDKTYDCCPDISHYLNYSDIKKIVGNEHFT